MRNVHALTFSCYFLLRRTGQRRSDTPKSKSLGSCQKRSIPLRLRTVVRKHNISEQTFYRCRNKYGGRNVSDARKLNALEAENAKTKESCVCRAASPAIGCANR